MAKRQKVTSPNGDSDARAVTTFEQPLGTLLTPEQLTTYRDTGYVVLRGVFAAEELDALRPDGIVTIDSGPSAADNELMKRCVVYGSTITNEDPTKITKLEGLGRLPRTCQISELFQKCSLHPGLAAIAAQVLGADAELMKDKYIFKAAGVGGGFLPHQDMTFIYNRVCTEAVNFGIAFDVADEGNGSLEVCAERFAEVDGRHVLPTTETKMENSVIDHLKFEHVNTSPGDVVVFNAWLLHRSQCNSADRDRNVYYVSYGLPGIPKRPPGSLYSDYYTLYDNWIKAVYPDGRTTAIDVLLGTAPELLRPSLIPPDRIGCGAPR